MANQTMLDHTPDCSTIPSARGRRCSGGAKHGSTHMLSLTTLSVALVCALLGACTQPTRPSATDAAATETKTDALPGNDLLNAVLYQQTAAEYRASTLQAFAQAKLALKDSLADTSITAAEEQSGDFQKLPPAIVVDVDETMLDNSAYQARLIKTGEVFADATWGEWVAEKSAPEVPGAREFSEFANKLGVRIIYLSNRDVSHTEMTRENLAITGFADAVATDNFFFRDKPNGFDTKGARRSAVAKNYRIVMMIGDNLGDFTESYKQSTNARQQLINNTATWWGSRWIMIPNPSYGSWENALYDYARDLTPAQQREAKHRALRLQQSQ